MRDVEASNSGSERDVEASNFQGPGKGKGCESSASVDNSFDLGGDISFL